MWVTFLKGASYDAVRAEAATASVSLEDVHADTDHLEADLRDARSKLRDLQKSDASRIVTSLRDTVERMNTKIAKQGTINDNVLVRLLYCNWSSGAWMPPVVVYTVTPTLHRAQSV